MRGRWVLSILAILAALLVTSCFLTPNREINLDMLYPSRNSSEVIVRYRVPPPPPGKLYVLWLLNPDDGKVTKIGELPPSASLRAVRATADFQVIGAIVSIETSADVSTFSNTWALESGVVKKMTPTPTR